VNARKHTTRATRLAAATVAAVAMNAAPLSADTITVFDVEGTVTDVSKDYGLYGINNFSGTLTEDVACTRAECTLAWAVDITFPGLDPFKYIWSSGQDVSIPNDGWEVVAADEPYPSGAAKYFLYLDILTQPQPDSPIGMTSGILDPSQSIVLYNYPNSPEFPTSLDFHGDRFH
jgi:hypothetical protein